MATSSGGTASGFWRSGVGRWLGSTKNLVGSGLGVAALALEFTVGLGPFWPIVVVASYGVGALLAPRDRVSLKLGLGDDATAPQLQEQLRLLEASLHGEAGRLDADAEAVVTKILGTLGDIVARWDDLAVAPEQRHTVQAMITDYLPTSLQTYLNLPRTFALSTRVAGKKTAHDELMDQLGILDTESGKIRDAVYSKEVDSLADQSRFLRQKFATSSLDLDTAPPPADDKPAPPPA
ncbi:MAG TPA: hypothetical protein VN759_06200 [Pseudolysinimonas sp.]|nr:hypothetical protein [Pseudolysinimonas sp.]